MACKKTNSLQMQRNGILLLVFLGGLVALLFTGCTAGRYYIDNLPPSLEGQPLTKYVMKQKIWTLADRFVIKDESKTPVFYVKGKLFSVGHKLSFLDVNGNELAYISQRLFHFTPTYKIYRRHRLTAKVVKKISLFKDRYIVDVSGPDDYRVTGNFWNYEYTFTRHGKVVAFVSKKFFTWSDTYGIAIVPGEDDIVILATAVVIDMVAHNDTDSNVFQGD
jgi:uncharacterized protein YxjI